MSSDLPARVELDGTGLRFGIVRARWNHEMVERLAVGALHAIGAAGITEHTTVEVSGSLELPLGAKLVAESATVDALVVLGVVIRGETTHYEIVSNECARGVLRVQLDTGVPVGFGVLTVEHPDQATARSEAPPGRNVGAEAAEAAIELALLRASLSRAPRRQPPR